MVTTEHQKWPKKGQQSIIGPFLARKAKKASTKGQSPPKELEVGPHSGPNPSSVCHIYNVKFSHNKSWINGQEAWGYLFWISSI